MPTLYYRGPQAPIVVLKPSPQARPKCGENRNHGKFKIYFLMVEL